MAPSLPFCEIVVRTRLPEAPPLYRWEDEESVVTLDEAIDDRPPPMPSRKTSTERDMHTKAVHKMPPRRPRRCATPPRNPRNIDIHSVPLKPMEFHRKRKQSVSAEIKYDIAQPLGQITSAKTLEGTQGPSEVNLVFCIRRTGCGACREHAMQLSDFVKDTQGVSLMGVIKPEAVPEARLLEFYTDYFNFPLYQDDDWKLFTAMGDRQLSLWKLIKSMPKMNKRFSQRQINSTPFGGDLFTHGGLLIFDKEQRLRFVYYEKYSDALDMEAIAWAVQDAQRPFKLNHESQQHHKHGFLPESDCDGSFASTIETRSSTLVTTAHTEAMMTNSYSSSSSPWGASSPRKPARRKSLPLRDSRDRPAFAPMRSCKDKSPRLPIRAYGQSFHGTWH